MVKYLSVWMVFCLILPYRLCGQFNLQDYGGDVSMSFKAGSDFIMINVQFKNVLPLNFIFDTGSEHTILFKKEYADLLGVTYDKRIPLMGSDLSKEIYGYIARGIQLNLDNKYHTVSDVLVLEEDYLRLEEFTGINIDGILGANIFRHFVVHISNRRDKVKFIDIASFKPPSRYEVIDISVFKNKPYIMAQAILGLNPIPLKLLIDTGAGLPILLYTNTHPSLHLPEETLKGNLGRGLGGQLEGYIGRLDGFSFHKYNFSGIISSFQEINLEHTEGMELNRNGIFGNGLLRRFDYFIDYAAEKLYVKANHRFRRKFKFDKSGLIVIATGRQLRDFVIQGVRDDTPAMEADIRQGDYLVKIEGIPTNLKTLSSINSILSSKIGRKVTMVIARGDERLKKKIKLREII